LRKKSVGDIDFFPSQVVTPLGKGGVFHDLSRGAYPEFVRYEIPWWICSALCVDVAKASFLAPTMTTGERVEKFGSPSLKTKYASMPEKAFRQESELEFVEMENAAYPVELIMSCSEAEYGSTTDSPLMFRHLSSSPTERDFSWLSRSRRGSLFAGYDPGRKRDQAALVILDLVNGKFVWLLPILSLQVWHQLTRHCHLPTI